MYHPPHDYDSSRLTTAGSRALKTRQPHITTIRLHRLSIGLSGMDAVQYCVLSPKKFIYVLRLDKAEGAHLPVTDQSKIITATKESLDIRCISEGLQQTTLYMK